MAVKTKARKTGKKNASASPAKKKASKKTTTKRSARKPAKKKIVKRRTGAATARTKAARRSVPSLGTKEAMTIEPGPPGITVPPVEEPAQNEEAIGTVTHYYSHLGVAVVQINKGMLSTGDIIRFKGHTTDFTQQIESMEYEHQHVDQALPGQSVGLKVVDHTREHDILFRVR